MWPPLSPLIPSVLALFAPLLRLRRDLLHDPGRFSRSLSLLVHRAIHRRFRKRPAGPSRSLQSRQRVHAAALPVEAHRSRREPGAARDLRRGRREPQQQLGELQRAAERAVPREQCGNGGEKGRVVLLLLVCVQTDGFGRIHVLHRVPNSVFQRAARRIG